MDCLNIKKDLEQLITGQVLYQEPMQNHTTWKVGGAVDIMVLPFDATDIQRIIHYASKAGLPLYIFGNGSNLLVLDKGIRGIVIKLNKCIDNIEIKDNIVVAGAGALLPKVARIAVSGGLKGLEFAIGIPASVGGAVTMNAGAHGNCISEVIQEVKVVTTDGEVKTIPVNSLNYGYRSSRIKDEGHIVVEAVFKLTPGDASELKRIITKNMDFRRNRQPLNYPNAGSVFKNPLGESAGRLIDEAGCKGQRVGQAKVSEVHANFIVNLGGAKASDIFCLINQVREKVKARFGIALELEVQIMGEA